jgi:high-affinity nickel permease
MVGGAAELIGVLNASLNDLGFVVVAIFGVAWAVSYMIYRSRRGPMPRVAEQRT